MTSDVVKAVEEDRFILCVAYSPHRLPRRGSDGRVDVVSPRTLEKGAWKFAAHGFKLGLNHQPGHEDIGKVVESTIYRGPDWTITGPNGSRTVVKAGDWLVGIKLSKAGWRIFKEGKITGVSMQGNAHRMAPSRETLAHVGVMR